MLISFAHSRMLPGQEQQSGNREPLKAHGQNVSRIEMLEDSIAFYAEQPDMPKILSMLLEAGNYHYEQESYDQAIEYFLTGLWHADEINADDKNSNPMKKEIDSLTGLLQLHIADVYSKMKNYALALNYYAYAENRFKSTTDTLNLMQTLNNYALAYNSSGNYQAARQQFQWLLQISTAYNDSNRVAGVFNNIGLVEFDNSRFNEARMNFEMAAGIYRRIGAVKEQVAAIYNIGLVMGYTGKYDSTITYYLRGLALLDSIGDISGKVKVQLGIAQYYHSKGRLDDSENYLLMALGNARKTGAANFITQIYKYLAQVKVQQNQFEEAFNFQEKYLHLHDSLHFKQMEKIAGLQRRYENRQAQRKRELLNRQNEIIDLKLQKQQNRQLYFILIALISIVALVILISRYRLKQKTNLKLNSQKLALQKANATRDKFFSIIAHDLKNVVFSTQNLTDVLYREFDKLNDFQKQKLAASLYKSGKHTSKLLVNLLQWARLQTGNLEFNPENFDLVTTMIRELELIDETAKQKNIEIRQQIPENTLVYADKNMVSTIIRNLLSNAIKFSSNHTSVLISCENAGDFVEISIKDQGEGIASGDIPKLFRIDVNTLTIPAAGQKGTGLGLVLCREFAQKNGGEIRVQSTKGKGSIFTFSLKTGVDEN